MKTQDNQKSMSKSKAVSSRNKTIQSQYANANSFKHLYQIPTANPFNIQWAAELRSNPQIGNKRKSNDLTSMTPQVYLKNTKSRQEKHSTADISEDVNISAYEHLAVHRIGSKPARGLLQFETSLRKDASKQKKMKQLQKRWSSIPRKDRQQQAKFIKSKSIKKKQMETEDFQIAKDGTQNYPKFTQKIIRVRNYNQFRQMLKGQVNLPSIGWQTNLRNY